jgi:peptide alpha-N-acetyltransferase
MPLSIRRFKIDDLIQMQNANLHCLQENYHMWYWLYHYLLAPQASHVAVDSRGKVLGYVLGKTDDEQKSQKKDSLQQAHITSVAVYSRNRKLGLATKLMDLTHKSVKECYRVDQVNLNVRETNRAGHILYEKVFGYKFVSRDKAYYADGEDGWAMRFTYGKDLDKGHRR